MIVTPEKRAGVLAELQANGAGTLEQLAKRLGWSETIVRGALELLRSDREVLFAVREDGRRVWYLERG